MGAEQHVGAVADSGANLAAESHRLGDGLEIGHAPVIDRILACRVEFHGGESLGDTGCRDFGAGMRVVVELRRIGVFRRVEIGVGPQPLIHQPAKKRVDRPVERLADNIPAGHLKAADNSLYRCVGAVGEPRTVRLAPEMLDPVGRPALQIAGEHVLGHPADDFRRETCGIDLADAGDAAGGGQPHKDEIAPAMARWRCSGDKGFQRVQPHVLVPRILLPLSLPHSVFRSRPALRAIVKPRDALTPAHHT